MIYVLLLAVTWLINGSLKFAVNWLRNRHTAFAMIGYGGFPSTHTAMVTSVVAYIGLTHGFSHPSFGLGLVVLWVVTNDATSLRKRIQDHARHLNQLDDAHGHRERIAHTWLDVAGGAIVGYIVAVMFHQLISVYFL